MSLIIDVSFPKSSKSQRLVLEEGQQLLVGRTNEKILLGPDPRLSRRHFSLRHVEGGFEITHLSQTNPTLLAPEQSRDFRQVQGTLLQAESCRVIAGAHRFVLTLEKAETLEQDSLPPADIHEPWSDVDIEEADDHSVDPTRQTRPADQRAAPFSFEDSLDENQARSERQAAQSQKHAFDSEYESAFEPVKQATPPERKKESHADKPSPAPIEFDEPTVTSSSSSRRDADPSAEPESPATDTDASSSKGSSPPTQDPPSKPSGKKMIFPVGDNFFDD